MIYNRLLDSNYQGQTPNLNAHPPVNNLDVIYMVVMGKVVDQIYFIWQVFSWFRWTNRWNIWPNPCK